MSVKRWWRWVRPYVLSPLIYATARLIGSTVRIEAQGYEPLTDVESGRIYAGWHGRTFVAALFFRGQGVWTIISKSRDGEMQDRIFRRFGFRTIRGSSGRGGVKAALESIKVLETGAVMAFTPDGPRGPSGVVQGGIVLMAKKSGAAVVPVGVSADRRWIAPTWDRFMIPKPFARAVMIFGEPIVVPADADEAALEAVRQRLEREMARLEAEAEAQMGHAAAASAADS